jgi:hypothetical protein
MHIQTNIHIIQIAAPAAPIAPMEFQKDEKAFAKLSKGPVVVEDDACVTDVSDVVFDVRPPS